MNRFLTILSLFTVVLTSCGTTYYIVRHAEKAAPGPNMTSDVPLSPQGSERAVALASVLASKKIGYVYATNTIRARSTAQPTADRFHLQVTTYGPRPDSAFTRQLKGLKKNTLVVGHSNTVDDIANMLCGRTVVHGDLADSVYNRLFIIKRKGKQFVFQEGEVPSRVITPPPF